MKVSQLKKKLILSGNTENLNEIPGSSSIALINLSSNFQFHDPT